MKKSPTSKHKDDDMPGSRPVSKIAKVRSFVVYGRSGTGKTTFAGTFPTPGILLDVRDEGTDSISDVKDFRVREIESYEDMEDAYWWLKKNPDRYKTVVIDTESQLQQMIVKEIVGEKGKKGKTAGDWGSMSQREWGEVAGKMKEHIINFRDLTKDGMNVVFIAQDRVFSGDDEDNSNGAIAPEVGPALSPAVAKHLNASVSVVVNTFIGSKMVEKEVKGKKKKIEQIRFGLRVGPNSVYTTKIRKGRRIEVPDAIYDPTYEDLIDLIKGEN